MDEFILEPASRHGGLDSIGISDEDVMSFARTKDLRIAGRTFARALGTPQQVSGLLNGNALPLLQSHKPLFVRVLVFACWAQVTSLRPDAERDLRELLSHRLGWPCPDNLIGLRRMWEHLRFWLAAEWAIDLRLPEGPHLQVGYTLRLAFPTWRDVQALRKMRDALPEKSLATPRAAAGRLIALVAASGSPPVFHRRFDEWSEAVRIGDPQAVELPFGRAWREVVAQRIPDGAIEVALDDFDDLHLAIRQADGVFEIQDIGTRELGLLSPRVAAAIRTRHVVYLGAKGFGRWTSVESRDATAVLLSGSALESAAVDMPEISRRRVGSSEWYLLHRDEKNEAEPDLLSEPMLRRIGGIRTSGGLLGLWPFTPRFLLTGPTMPSVDVSDEPVNLDRIGNELRFPAGTWTGRCRVAMDGRPPDTFKLVGEALEHPDDDLRPFEDGTLIAEDGPLRNTRPIDAPMRSITQQRDTSPSCDLLQALEEAVYARSGRRISMGELVGLAAVALEGTTRGPSPWDVVRAFVDAGWLEPALVRRAPARLYAPIPPYFAVSALGDRPLLVLDGLAGRRMRGRIIDTAANLKLDVIVRDGQSEWTLPTVAIVAARETWNEITSRTGLPIKVEMAPRSPAAATWSTVTTALGYQTSDVWNDASKRFEGSSDDGAAGFARMVRPQLDGPPIYRLGPASNARLFASPTLALLVHLTSRRETVPFLRKGTLLLRREPRAHLPAAWGRWLRKRALTSPGPVRIDGSWTYAYPIDDGGMESLLSACPLATGHIAPSWTTVLLRSRRGDLPLVATRHGVLDARRGR